MTVKEARGLYIGDTVIYGGVVKGIVTDIRINSTGIQWHDRNDCLYMDHTQMGNVELARKPTQKGRYDK